MLYLEGDTALTWPAVATALGASGPLHMAAQMYSTDDVPPAPFALSSKPQWLETVTTFPDDDNPVSSDPIAVDEKLLAMIATLLGGDFENDGDLTLYRPGDREWIAAAIPHERMVLIRDDALAVSLQDAGLQVSTEPPDWW